MEWDLKMPPAVSWELADELENSGGGGVPAAVSSSSAAVGGGVNAGGGGRQECSVDLKLGGFHLLQEFDEAKRSCRKRLDGHNRRRRKPQPDPMNSASYLASQQGARFSPFATPRPEPSWTGMIKTEDSPYYTHHQIPLGISSRQQHFVGSTSDGGRRFPFLQEGEISFGTGAGAGGVPMDQAAAAAAASVCQPLLKTVAPPPPPHGGGGSGGGKMFSDGGLTQVLDSDCALSLLSAPANSTAIDVGGGRMVIQPTEHMPMAQPLIPGLQIDGSNRSTATGSHWRHHRHLDGRVLLPVCQPLLKTVAPPPPPHGGGGSGGGKMFSDGGLTQVLDSDCALSLLSAPANSTAIDVGGGRVVVQPTEHIPMAQPLISGLQFGGGGGSSAWFAARPHHQAATGAAATAVVVSTAGFSCPVVESEQLNTVLSSNDNEMNYNGMFHVGGEGSSDGTSSSLPFSWQ
uniref:SBP-type domain-containing protein n=1 Tax=Oryza barthii TaxID=65489 RepID=A0A0D3H2H9_9ORYZ